MTIILGGLLPRRIYQGADKIFSVSKYRIFKFQIVHFQKILEGSCLNQTGRQLLYVLILLGLYAFILLDPTLTLPILKPARHWMPPSPPQAVLLFWILCYFPKTPVKNVVKDQQKIFYTEMSLNIFFSISCVQNMFLSFTNSCCGTGRTCKECWDWFIQWQLKGI